MLVRVFDQRQADELQKAGTTPIIEADAAAQETLAWFDRWRLSHQNGEPSVADKQG